MFLSGFIVLLPGQPALVNGSGAESMYQEVLRLSLVPNRYPIVQETYIFGIYHGTADTITITKGFR